MNEQLWIGLANVVPHQNTEYDFDGAFVTVLCLAKNNEEFVSVVNSSFEELEMEIIEISDVEKYLDRKKRVILDDDITELANEVELSRRVCFGTFHAYDAANEN